MRHVIVSLFVMCWAGLVGAQDVIPPNRYVLSEDVDFYGADRTALFDTTFDACQRACSADDACVAFTYNGVANACFPKSAVNESKPYVGAVSAVRLMAGASLQNGAQTRASALTLTAEDLAAALDLATGMGRRFPVNDRTVEALADASRSEWQQGNRVAALRWIGAAVALGDTPDLWARYAYISLRLSDTVSASQRRTARSEAVPAAINAYLRATTPGSQTSSLSTLAEALEANQRGRDMLSVLRLAQSIQPRDDIATALEDAIGKYGFRIVDHEVQSDSAAPRICATFSEPLVQAGVDYEPFVRIDAEGVVVQADNRDLCIDGVRHGERYRVTFRSGLPSASGETLSRDMDLDLYVRDRSPLVRFPGRSYVLPRSSAAAVPIETVNLDSVTLTLSRVSDRNLVRAMRDGLFGRPLAQWQLSDFNEEIAEEIWRGTGDVQNDLNAEMRTRLPLGDAIKDQAPGVYVLMARPSGADPNDAATASQWFVLSDLGLTTWQGTDGLTAAVRRLGDAGPVPAATVRLISRANAVLGVAETDSDGFATFPAGLTRGNGASAPALLQVETEDDFVFLPLTDPAFDLSDRGVEGRPPAPPIDLFVTTDRGAYRPGATIHVTALARTGTVSAIPGLPITAILSRPDGVEYSRTVSTQDRAGGHVLNLPIGASVPRGTWRIDLKSDLQAPPLASRTVLVEDFVPERIDVDLTLPESDLQLGGRYDLAVEARYLFGAAGADLPVEGDLTLRRRTEIEGWPGYRFGRYDGAFSARRSNLETRRTDAAGLAAVPLDWPEIDVEEILLEADLTIRVSDGAGRPVERSITRPVAPQGPLIGIRPTFDDILPEGGTAQFDLVAVGADAPVPVQWTVNRIETRYQWYQLYGNWNWEPITRRVRVGRGELTLTDTPIAFETSTDWGDYELVVERTGGRYTASSVAFSAGWYGGTDSAATPDRLVLSLDAASYELGDVAQLRLVPPFDGVALVTVLSDGVIARQSIPVTAGESVIPLEVTESWGTGAYVTASILRGTSADDFGPARVLGLAHASVDPGDKALNVRINAPTIVSGQAGETMVDIRVDGLGETPGYVTLAAVDVGILNLTGFEAPDPQAHYFGQRRLGVELRDMYGRLIDGRGGAMGQVRSGGDAGNRMQRQSPPPTEAVMASFHGPVRVGPDGRATVSIPRPNFNGTIRLMAVAWSDTGVGQATQDMLARDPVVISAALPRFMAPGDESRLMLDFVHAEGATGPMALTVAAEGLVLGPVPGQIDLTEGATVRVPIALSVNEVGDHQISVALTLPDGTALTKVLTLGVRSTDPIIASTRRFSLGAGEVFTFDNNVFANLRPASARATLSAGPLARFDMPALLRQLDRYPYGCTEQVTSAALPLLYLPNVAGAAGIEGIGDRIETAIAQVLTRQASNGAFGLWSAQSGAFWLDAYVTDFLSQAQAKGYRVPDVAMRLALDNLRNRINYAPDFDSGGEDIAYALWVLAREGAAAIGDLRYYADAKAEAFATSLARGQLGAALASYGEQTRADRMFGLAEDLARTETFNSTTWREDFGSPLRDRAGLLYLAAEADSTRIDRTALAQSITDHTGRFSTQEAAQVLMAAQAVRTSAGPATLSLDDVPVSGPLVQTRAEGDPVSVIRNVSGRPQDVTLTTYGVPDVAPEAGGYGYAITRETYDLNGQRVEGPWTVGERRVVVLRVTPFEEVGARLIVDDPLPAGIEIDNPNVLRAGDVRALDWLNLTEAEHAEFRTDRFIAAVNQRDSMPFTLAYVARAVSPGIFHHPAALVEDMYRPEYRAITGTGATTVTE
ncbi:alpha-2-macroglobulin family protein [Tateyamaria pelophila]